MPTPWAVTFRLGHKLDGAHLAKVLLVEGGEVVVRLFREPPRVDWRESGDYPQLDVLADEEIAPDDLRVLSLDEWEALGPGRLEISATLSDSEAMSAAKLALSNGGKLCPEVQAELSEIEPSRSPGFAIRACEATLSDGTVHPRVAFVGDLEAVSYLLWFAKNRLSAADVVHVEASSQSLPPAIATQVYQRQPNADETYSFVVETARGLSIRFKAGPYVDFPGIPAEYGSKDLLSLAEEGVSPDVTGALPPDFEWCLYESSQPDV